MIHVVIYTLYSFVVYLYVNGSGSITSVGVERAKLPVVVYLLLCGFCLERFPLPLHRIYSAELQLNKANASDTEATFLDLNLLIHNDIVSTKTYDKRDDFNLILLIFRSLMAMSLNFPLMVYIYLSLFAFRIRIIIVYW